MSEVSFCSDAGEARWELNADKFDLMAVPLQETAALIKNRGSLLVSEVRVGIRLGVGLAVIRYINNYVGGKSSQG